MAAKKKNGLLTFLITAVVLVGIFVVYALTRGEGGAYGTFWALVPPIIAIALALITKEVYSSLFIGLVAGALFYADLNPLTAYNALVTDSIVAQVSGGAGILVFLVLLGILVVLTSEAGGSAAYGAYMAKKIKSKKGASLATMLLGIIIFIDDYFNCLTVGSVMRPVTDKFKISRAKLAWLIDSTAAPICIIAPVSSWAAAVSSTAEQLGVDGLALFIKAIPYNLYALLTIALMFFVIILKADFGPMRKHEANAENGDLFSGSELTGEGEETVVSSRGRVIDLVLPVIILIIACVIALLYVGGFFGGDYAWQLIGAFGNTDATVALPLGSLAAILFTVIYYICRRVLTFNQCMSAIPKGFKTMVPSVVILVFAWSLSGITKSIGAAEYVKSIMEMTAGSLDAFLPAVIFIVGCILSFATGTSWGTFGILLPIVVPLFDSSNPLLIVCISACLAGAVCGDHCSPISDTTIMSSTGAQCDHVNHVSTQLPYAIFVAVISFLGFLLAGFVQNVFLVLGSCLVVLVGALLVLRTINRRKDAQA